MFIALLLACTQAADVAPLVEAERAFAAQVKAKGLKAGFLSVMDNESVLFRPGPVPGHKATADSPDSPAMLEWEPAFAAATKSGKYGFTTGPWQVRPKAGEEPVAFGHYMSAWRKAEAGWRLIMDCGTSTDEAPVQPYTVKPLSFGIAPTSQELSTAAKAFSEGRAELAATQCDASAISYWTGGPPAIGPKAIESLGKTHSMTDVKIIKAQNWEEMGLVYGSFTSGPGNGYFVQIWRKEESGLKLLCEMQMLQPAAPTT